MKDRVLIFSSPSYLSIQHAQLQIVQKKTGQVFQQPLDNVGFIFLESARVVLTQSVLRHAAAQNIAVVVCDEKHLPTSILLPYQAHCTTTKLAMCQAEASLPFKKTIWKLLMVQKIKNQKRLLQKIVPSSPAIETLEAYSKQVRSGDPNHVEAQAARHYFKPLYGIDFSRIPQHGDYINNCLDYGYTILRSATARELARAGLIPQLAIKHKNQYNAHPLADDMIEPFRPFVDELVYALQKKTKTNAQASICKEDRIRLQSILSTSCVTTQGKSTLLLAIREATSSLAKAFLKKDATYLLTYGLC